MAWRQCYRAARRADSCMDCCTIVRLMSALASLFLLWCLSYFRTSQSSPSLTLLLSLTNSIRQWSSSLSGLPCLLEVYTSAASESISRNLRNHKRRRRKWKGTFHRWWRRWIIYILLPSTSSVLCWWWLVTLCTFSSWTQFLWLSAYGLPCCLANGGQTRWSWAYTPFSSTSASWSSSLAQTLKLLSTPRSPVSSYTS